MLRPREIVVSNEQQKPSVVERIVALTRVEPAVTSADGWSFEPEAARRALLDQLKTHGLEGFGLEGRTAAIQAAGALVTYLRDTQKADLAHVRAIGYRTSSDSLIIDPITLKHLEVVTGSEGGAQGSLLHEIDRTITSMGGRLLRAWLLRPLCALERIRDRLDAVEELAFRSTERGKFRDTLKGVHDLERLIGRVALGTAGPRDLVSLRQSLETVPRIRLLLDQCQAPLMCSLLAELDDLADVRDLIERTLLDEPPALVREGGFTRDGVDPALDELKAISRSGRQVIAEMEERERARTGIASLKVRFNRVFGYYIEISKANLHLVPSDYLRKQTIAGGERFTTPALKEYEEKVLGADERILARELEIFEALRSSVAAEAGADSGHGARARHARRPGRARRDRGHRQLHQAAPPRRRRVRRGRRSPPGRRAIRRRVRPERHRSQRHHPPARGPDRSEHGRQVDLPSADGAHPAHGADRVVRAGATGEASGRRSHLRARRSVGQHRPRALHVHGRDAGDRQHPAHGDVAKPRRARRDRSRHVDVRRAEHRLGGRRTPGHEPRARPKTLFATHYHELTDLADALPGVVNAHVSAREWKDQIIFLRKIVSGRSDRSYGIQVARLAGLPASVVTRAQEILAGLERDEASRGGRPTLSAAAGGPSTAQLGLFAASADGGSQARRARAVSTRRQSTWTTRRHVRRWSCWLN